ncbi:MAG TPA: group 1 truncated hemoglobin [Gemmatimonadaceae bacterium]|nr:group 1 truncated hemoglobin [Gemmatimonadaceae bacterium]
MSSSNRTLMLLGATLISVACARSDDAATDTATSTAAAPADSIASKTLYDRLGGKGAITSVVDSFVAIVAKDDRINKKFARSDVSRVKSMLVDQVCNAAGGPCTYTGRSMKEAHRNMGVTGGEFDALVEDLVASLNAFNVPKAEQDELLTALGTMKPDIVEVHGQNTGTPLPRAFVSVRDSAKK